MNFAPMTPALRETSRSWLECDTLPSEDMELLEMAVHDTADDDDDDRSDDYGWLLMGPFLIVVTLVAGAVVWWLQN